MAEDGVDSDHAKGIAHRERQGDDRDYAVEGSESESLAPTLSSVGADQGTDHTPLMSQPTRKSNTRRLGLSADKEEAT